MKRPGLADQPRYQELLLQFIKFAGVGVIGTGGHYLTLVVLVQFVGLQPVLGTTCGFVVGAFINYYLNYIYTFKSDKSHKEAMTKFFTVALFGMCLNAALMFVGTHYFRVHYFIVQIFATGAVLMSNFALNRIWTFAKSEQSS